MKTVAEMLASRAGRVVTVGPADTVLDAIKVLAAEDVGAALVMDGMRLAGILSERDYTRKIVLQGRSSDTTRVADIMSPQVVCVSPRSTTRECMALMIEHQIRHLPVVEDGHVAGMISIRDIVGSIIEEQDFTIEQLEHYISGQ